MNVRLSAAQLREQQWVARYVAGKLSEAESDAFEDYCVAHPEIVDEVALEKRMKAGLASTAKNAPTQFESSTRQRRWMLAAAAAVLLVAATSLFEFFQPAQNASGGEILADAHTPGINSTLERFRLAQIRSDKPPSLGVASSGLVELQLAGAFQTDARYDIELALTDASGHARILARLARQQPDSNDEIRVLLNAAQIPAGAYSLTTTRDGTADTRVFEFMKD